LVQDAVHDTLLRAARQQLHTQIAEALEANSPEMMDSQPEVLARHYGEAGLVEKTASYWGKAGYRSAARSAMAEATAQFQNALDQLGRWPDPPDRQRRELELRTSLGAALMVVKGFAAPETGQVYGRARRLWEELGSPAEFLHVPRGQALYHNMRGEIYLAQRLDTDLLRLSRQRNHPAGHVLGHLCPRQTPLY